MGDLTLKENIHMDFLDESNDDLSCLYGKYV